MTPDPTFKPWLHRAEPKPLATAPHEPQITYLHQLRKKSADFRHLLTHILLPAELLVQFGISPVTLRNTEGRVMVEIAESDDGHIWAMRLLNDVDRRDPLLEVELADTVFGRISVTWVGMNDPRAPRFGIDRQADGDATLRGTAQRNLEAEAAAMVAGLAPGQVRRGLGVFQRLLWDLEQFFAALHHEEFEVEPLFYHNAILFERHGFQYVRGRGLMQRIHEGFAPGGEFQRQLDGSTPFRDPAQANSIRGRAWALHDGVLGEPWDGVKLVKRLGKNANENSAPDVSW